jgi:hypothetical protein
MVAPSMEYLNYSSGTSTHNWKIQEFFKKKGKYLN